MSTTYFIADTHFGDDNIRCYENRPFADTSEMDRELIKRWNSIVSDTDNVYILGDFGAGNSEAEILCQLSGDKFLIKGNHDTQSNSYYRAVGFREVYDLPVIFNGFWILSHEPIYVNSNMPYANLFGHVHNSPLFKNYSNHHFCVSVERINYTPISLEEIILKVKD